MELGTTISLLEELEEEKYVAVITAKSEKEEVLHIDGEFENKWPIQVSQ